ncbi:hypothetical protein [Candidatus Rhodobacter oscarellae]|uniref:hypothetical protein n=1 Tax=Candidatus Rhodobacter oscarellae TaxID=1675527 RepID=UPI00128F99CB|nr:hypothetical protein [Candidatus Rhodobacter lobularis]
MRRQVRGGRGAAALCAAILLGQPASAGSCAALRDFIAGPAIAVLSGATCRDALTETGAGGFCQWGYAYRSEAARAGFARQVAKLTECFPDAAPQPSPHRVNHPDTHDVRLFDLGDTRITISLKDKARLGKSFVFMQVAPAWLKAH